jgi:hypothetical protein
MDHNQPKKEKPTIEGIKLGDHVCSIYKNEEEQFAPLAIFIKKGLDNNEKCIYIVDENSKDHVVAETEKRGIDIKKYIESGQFVILTKKETYLKEGYFDPDGMIKLLKDTEKQALDNGYSGLRVTGEMTWVLEGMSGSDKLIEYEAN